MGETPEITNLSDDFVSGRVFSALIASYDPSFIEVYYFYSYSSIFCSILLLF